MVNLFAGLNPEQHHAVTTTEGPVLVLAGAGTGKTRGITVRIAYLLSEGVPPHQILAMTFTNKAAREMRERVKSLVGKKLAEQLTIGTFHAFCARTLREHAEVLGLQKSFSICDASDQLTTVKMAMRELRISDVSLHPSFANSRISLLKNKLITAKDLMASACDDKEELLARVYERYDDLLRRQCVVDFDDLLLMTGRLLKQHEDIRTAFRNRYRYVMVDEYQDTNGPQYEIVLNIAEEHKNLCVVGDDDQSIYGWRGADIEKILGFEKDFSGATVVRLETNYRSTGHILDAANKVIAHNADRHPKTLRSAQRAGTPPEVVACDDEMDEASYVVTDLARAIRAQTAKAGDFAILYRTQQQPRPLEAQLRAEGIPYVLVGGQSFFDRKEIRDVLAYVRLLANPDDEASLMRIINRPARGVGKGSIDKIIGLATLHSESAYAATRRALAEGILKPLASKAIEDLLNSLERYRHPEPTDDIVSRIGHLLDEVSYRTEVDRTYRDERARRDRWNGVLEIFDLAENYVTRATSPTLSEFLEKVALAQDDSTDEDPSKRNAVTLMTLHAAKGLEYPQVYLVGAEEGLLPHQASVEEGTIDEERRLMYVGITRAQRRFVVSHAKSRSRFGTRNEAMKSRFLFEMTGEKPPEEWRPAHPKRNEDLPGTRSAKPTSGPSKKKAGKKLRQKKPTRKKSSSKQSRG